MGNGAGYTFLLVIYVQKQHWEVLEMWNAMRKTKIKAWSALSGLHEFLCLSILITLLGIFPTQRWNPGLPHCRRILYQLSHKGSPRNTEGDSLSLLQRIFPTQESNWCLLHCRRLLYQLSYQGTPLVTQGGRKRKPEGNRSRSFFFRKETLMFVNGFKAMRL